LPTPSEKQALADIMARCDSTDCHTRFLRFDGNAQLVRYTPTPPTLTPGDDFHHTIYKHTSSAT
jgi:hypothetical protein